MQVSVETLEGLERKITISVPAAKIEEEVSQRLKDLARKVKIDGFRPGKVPMNEVKKRYSENVRIEVAGDMVQNTLPEALKEKNLNPAGYPEVSPGKLELGKDFEYTATFEVFPEIDVKELNQAEVERFASKVAAKDVNDMIEKLLEQHMEWNEVEREAKQGDKLVIDFKGSVDGEVFEGGTANDFEVTIGSGSMIPGFEEGLVGKKAGDEAEIKVTFPQDYGHKDLAGKDAVFTISVNTVMAGKKPALDDAFAEQFNIKEGGVEALKKDIKENMERELERRVNSMNKEKLFDKLMDVNEFNIPSALVEQEIENLKKDMYQRIFGRQPQSAEKMPEFPKEIFEEQAQRRVKLGLLFSEYVKKHSLKVTDDRIEKMLDILVSAYEDPEEVKQNYKSNKQTMSEIEALVMEDMVAEKIADDAVIKETKMTYDEVMNPKKNDEEETNHEKEGA